MLLILGTHNRKKAAELRVLLEPFGFELSTLADLPNAIDVIEDGDSFEANAQRKAAQQALHLGAWVLGEDSGLVVDALGGQPGIYSARFAGPDASDEQNNQKLLEELREVPTDLRTAHYVCHLSLADRQGRIVIDREETCCGRIVEAPRGTAGFGYDPLFEIPEYHRTVAELGACVKTMLSHRSRAIRAFVPQLLTLATRRDWDA